MNRIQAFPTVQASARPAGGFRTQACWPCDAPIARKLLDSRPDDGCMLPAGQAFTVRASQSGVLRITQGRVWITFSGSDKSRRMWRTGDHFCETGESLRLAAGETMVMEPWARSGESPARVRWEPALVGGATHESLSAAWHAGVLQPLLDLRLALGLATRAMGRLLRGVAGGVLACAGAAMAKVASVW